ncbi:unnamed protein product [Schistosoma rodhaini]|nr:unnamed protein product [Schistosoma rodhaini]
MSVMCKSFLFSLFILSMFITKMEFSDSNCKQKGEECSKTVFSPCCGNLVCKLDQLFHGKCVDYVVYCFVNHPLNKSTFIHSPFLSV